MQDLMLLTDCHDPEPLFESDEWAAEEKLDGDRRVIMRVGMQVGCFTREGHTVAPSDTVLALALLTDGDFTIDGEMMPGGEFVAFDIIEWGSRDVRWWCNHSRVELLHSVSPFRCVRRATGEQAKRELCEQIKAEGGEGIVFKHIGANYSAGRTRYQQRLKNYETETFDVVGVDISKGSITVARDGKAWGGVPSSMYSLPKVGDKVRVRFEKYTPKGKLLRAKIVK